MANNYLKTLLAASGIVATTMAWAENHNVLTTYDSSAGKQTTTYYFCDRPDADGLTIGTEVAATVYTSTSSTTTKNLYALTNDGLTRIALGESVSSGVSDVPSSGYWWWREMRTKNDGYDYSDGLQLYQGYGGLAVLNVTAGTVITIEGVGLSQSGSYAKMTFPGATSIDGTDQTPSKASDEATYSVTYSGGGGSSQSATETITITVADDYTGTGYVAAYVAGHKSTGYIYSIAIEESVSTAPETTTYTVNYVCDGTNVYASDEFTVVSGSGYYVDTKKLATTIADDGTKYTLEKIGTMTESDGNKSIDVTFTAEKYSYTVYASTDGTSEGTLLGTLSTGASCAKVTYYPPRYINVGGTLYDSESSGSSTTFTPDADGYAQYIEFTATNITGVVFEEEGEDNENLTKVESTSYSGAAGGTFSSTDPLKLVHAPAGSYVFNGRLIAKSGGITYTLYDGNGDDKNTLTSFKYSFATGTIGEQSFNVSSACDVYMGISATGYGYDWAYIYAKSFTKTIPSYNLVSFSAPFDAAVPDGVYVYIAKEVTSSEVTLSLVSSCSVIPANTGVILYSETTGDISLTTTTTASTSDFTDNLLVASSSTPTVPTDGTYYALKYDSSSTDAVFAQVQGGTELSCNKAYLPASTTSGAKLKITFDDLSTGIETITAKSNKTDDGAYYNLQGVRVENPTKGLYIQNGKKVIIK